MLIGIIKLREFTLVRLGKQEIGYKSVGNDELKRDKKNYKSIQEVGNSRVCTFQVPTRYLPRERTSNRMNHMFTNFKKTTTTIVFHLSDDERNPSYMV